MSDNRSPAVGRNSGKDGEGSSSVTAPTGGGGGEGAGQERQTGGAEGAQSMSLVKGIKSDFMKQREDADESDDAPDHDAFDEPDDELEEFDIIGGDQSIVDLEAAQWDEDWDAAGWDDEDVNDDFIKRLQQELDAFTRAHFAKQQQQQQTTPTR